MTVHGEVRFEDAIDIALIGQGGFERGIAKLDPVTALFVVDVLTFVQSSQPTRWEQLVSFQGPAAGDVLIDGLVKELAAKGALHVLRHGFKCFGKAWRLAFFRPNTGLNPQALADYAKNTLRVHRQVHFSERHPHQSVDVVLSVNGLPLVTVELKNTMTGQTVEHGKRQYKEVATRASRSFVSRNGRSCISLSTRTRPG